MCRPGRGHANHSKLAVFTDIRAFVSRIRSSPITASLPSGNRLPVLVHLTCIPRQAFRLFRCPNIMPDSHDVLAVRTKLKIPPRLDAPPIIVTDLSTLTRLSLSSC